MEEIIVFDMGECSWVDLESPSVNDLVYLKSQYPFLRSEDLTECMPPLQHTKFVPRDGYVFMVFQFPVFVTAMQSIAPAELDVFASKGVLITVHDKSLSPLIESVRSQLSEEGIEYPTAEILHRILYAGVHAAFPLLLQMSDRLSEMRAALFDPGSKNLVRDLLSIKSDIVAFKSSVQAVKPTLERMISYSSRELGLKNFHPKFSHLIERTKDVWNLVESDLLTVNTLSDAYLSLQGHRTSQIMKRLTTIFVATLPPTIILAIVNLPHVPITEREDGWIIAAIIAAVSSVVAILIMKWKKWI